MKRGRRLTPPQPFQRKDFRLAVERLREWQGVAKAQCLSWGHEYNRWLGCCLRCGEAMPEIKPRVQGSSNLMNMKIEISIDSTRWQQAMATDAIQRIKRNNSYMGK